MISSIRACVPACCLVMFSFQLIAQPANRFDVVIDELMPDPSPPVQLPNYEFIELKNVSGTAFNLKSWKVSDGSSTATITANFILKPDSFVIVCSNSAAAAFASFGRTIGVSNFPSLNNDADVISLYSAEGRLIHAVGYNSNWYQNAVKSDGGWSLEMIDTHNPCSGINNWTASTNATGGTPGKINAVNGINKDDDPPVLYRTYTIDSTTITAVFDEPLDSATAANALNYTINNGIGHPAVASVIAPLYTEVLLKPVTPLNKGTVYELTITNVTDCAGNVIAQFNTTKAGLPSPADSFGIVINEILFNPKPGGYDYIELYNRSNKIIDLKQLYIAARNATNQLTTITQLSTGSYLFYPGEYRVFTENSQWLQQQYLLKDSSVVTLVSSLPSMPDDKGTLVLLNLQGAIIDELHYDAKWHFALIEDKQGVALERISYNSATQDKSNWTSAAATAGFGTPGFQNSQLMADAQVTGQVTVLPTVFSPDNDGWNDYATITYQLNEPGYVANIRIFDSNGRLVRYLVQNATLSTAGSFRWDGLSDKLNKLPVGVYIILTELFNLQGKSKKFKQAITLARRF